MTPLTPLQCDLRGLPYMPLDCARLLESDTYALTTGDEFKAALTLWCRSWSQVPAASLPDSERILAKWAGVSLSEWREVREQALRGWLPCADGRLYHPVVAEKALTAWLHRLSLQERSAKANDRPGRTFAYDPAQFEQLRRDADGCLRRVQEMLAPLPEGADCSPTGSATASNGTPSESLPTSEVEGEAEVEGGGESLPSVLATNVHSIHVQTDVQAALDAYNEAAERLGLPRALTLTKKRRAGISDRLRDVGMDGWLQVLTALAQSPHHLGQNDRGWRADLDFIIREDKFQRFLEGTTIPADRRSAGGGSGGSYLALAAAAMQPSSHQSRADRDQQAALRVLERRGLLA